MSKPVGKQLKEARLKKGMSIEDIAHETRIPAKSLQSLEEDDYSTFPNPTYAKGFLQIYADFLEVDASEMIEALSGPKTKGIGGRMIGQGPPPIDLTPTGSTIPIFKVQEERRSSSSLMSFSLIVALIIMVPTVYLVGKRSGFQEMAGEQLSSTIGRESSSPEAIADPAKQAGEAGAGDTTVRASYEPPLPEPDPEFNRMIGIDPPAASNSKPAPKNSGDSALPMLNPESDLDN